MIVNVHATYCHLNVFMYMETPKNVVLVVKRYAVLEAQKWRYAVRKSKKGGTQYAMGRGVTISMSVTR